ncbi:N-6 DNA methylase [Fischerella sp. JS2]|uniref:N-6 DNA methylase n=1 Tax=Fischerella sp. JS2 TaxID=2597771 RepID=UPI0037BEEBEE
MLDVSSSDLDFWSKKLDVSSFEADVSSKTLDVSSSEDNHGEFFTPRNVQKMTVRILRPKVTDKIIDLFPLYETCSLLSLKS